MNFFLTLEHFEEHFIMKKLLGNRGSEFVVFNLINLNR